MCGTESYSIPVGRLFLVSPAATWQLTKYLHDALNRPCLDQLVILAMRCHDATYILPTVYRTAVKSDHAAHQAVKRLRGC